MIVYFPVSPFRFYTKKYYIEVESMTFIKQPEFILYNGLLSTDGEPTAWYFQVDPFPDILSPTLTDNGDGNRGLYPRNTIHDDDPHRISYRKQNQNKY